MSLAGLPGGWGGGGGWILLGRVAMKHPALDSINFR